MSKHRSRKKYRKPYASKNRNVEASNNITPFFSTILPFIEKLEKEDKILLVLPIENNLAQGIVIGDELSSVYTQAYVEGTQALIKQCGSVEAYFDRRLRNPEWYAKNNPDKQLLTLLKDARLVISYRYGLAIGNAEYADSENEPSNNRNVEASQLPSLEDMPIFITMMQFDGTPSAVGYELNGIITLENYKQDAE